MIMRNRVLSGIWNVERVLREYLALADESGNIRSAPLDDDSPDSIKVRRLVAAMKAYGKEEVLNGGIEYLVSETCSDEKINEFCQFLEQNQRDEYSKHLAKTPELFTDSFDRGALFEILYRYRKSLYKTEHIWSGMLECSRTIALAIKATNSLYQKHIKEASDTIDRMLVLLMGDDFDRTFTEEELLPFGYPDVTDNELENIILDNF